MHPINNRNFGPNIGRLAVKFYSGGSVVTGYIVKQTGTNRFLVSKLDGTGQKICNLAQTSGDLTALSGGDLTLCTIEVAKYGGGTENVRHLTETSMQTVQGSALLYTRGVSGSVTGSGTISVRANVAPTVANAIPDQVATVAGAFSYVIPANTFADANPEQTLTYTATLVGGAALSTVGFAFAPSTRTVTKAAGAGSASTVAIRVTASDGTLTVFDDFNVVVS